MGKIHIKNVFGFQIEEEICCYFCITKKEFNELTEDKIITRKVFGNAPGFVFCDRCKKRIG